MCGKGECGWDAAIGWRQLLFRDCSGLGRERAGHVLPPWNASQPSQALGAPETGRDKGNAPSSVRDDFLEKVSVGGTAWNCSRWDSLELLSVLCDSEGCGHTRVHACIRNAS